LLRHLIKQACHLGIRTKFIEQMKQIFWKKLSNWAAWKRGYLFNGSVISLLLALHLLVSNNNFHLIIVPHHIAFYISDYYPPIKIQEPILVWSKNFYRLGFVSNV